MVSVATKVDLPMKFTCPSIGKTPIPHCSMIGLGDLVLPGIFVAFCYRLDLMKTNSHYYAVCMFGYATGLLCCIAILFIYDTG